MAATASPLTSPPRLLERPRLTIVEPPGPPRRTPRPEAAQYRRRRLVVGLATAFVLLALASMVGSLVGHLAAIEPAPPTTAPSTAAVAGGGGTYVVQPGDTVWAIAARITPPDDDVRATVDRLVAANGGSVVVPGDRLVLGG